MAAGSFALIKYSQSSITGRNPQPHQHLTGHSHNSIKIEIYLYARHSTVIDMKIQKYDGQTADCLGRMKTEATFQSKVSPL